MKPETIRVLCPFCNHRNTHLVSITGKFIICTKCQRFRQRGKLGIKEAKEYKGK